MNKKLRAIIGVVGIVLILGAVGAMDNGGSWWWDLRAIVGLTMLGWAATKQKEAKKHERRRTLERGQGGGRVERKESGRRDKIA